MSRRARDRYQGALDLERDLRAFLDHRPVQARPIGALRRSLRRLRRSKAALGAAAALVLVGLVLAGSLLRARVQEGRHQRWMGLYARFPPNFTIVLPKHRALLSGTDRADLQSLLDEAAKTCIDPLPTHLLRASLRLDYGDQAGAAADMETIARHEGTAFSRALADRYSELNTEELQLHAISFDALPEPSTPRDRYLKAYHDLRSFEDDAALELLDEEVCAALPHAEELRFALVNLGAFDTLERQSQALELLADIERLEERMGVRTATTAHFAAYALSSANVFDLALEAGLEGIDLAPRSHVNRTTTGFAAFALGRYDLAREVLSVATELCPGDSKPIRTMLWSYVAEGRFDEALAFLERTAPAVVESIPWWYEGMAADIEVYRVLGAAAPSEGSDSVELDASVQRLRGHLERAYELGFPRTAFLPQVLDALDAEDPQRLVTLLATEFSKDVRRLWRLRILRQHLPDRLEPAALQAVEGLIEAFELEMTGTPIVPR